MKPTRRDLRLLLPALLACEANAQTSKPALPSKCYEFTELPVKIDPKTHNETRAVFDGYTHTAYPVDVHITTLASGMMPHAAHHHAHVPHLQFAQQANRQHLDAGNHQHCANHKDRPRLSRLCEFE